MRKCDSCGKTFAETKDVFCPHCGAVATKGEVCTHTAFDDDRYNTSGKYSFHGEQKNESAPFQNPQNKRTFAGSAVPKKSTHTNLSGPKVLFITVFAIVFFLAVAATLAGISDTPNDVVVPDFPVTKYRDLFVTDSYIKAYPDDESGLFSIDLRMRSGCLDERAEPNDESVASADDVRTAMQSGNARCLVTVFEGSADEWDESYYTVSLYFDKIGDGVFFAAGAVLPCEEYLMISGFNIEDMNSEITANFPYNAFKISKNGNVSYYNITNNENGEYVVAAASTECDPITGYADSIDF